MLSLERIADLRQAVSEARCRGRSIGLVPTMGALHRGHAALIERSAADGCFTVVSIFVNPAQFGPGEDFERYPRTPEDDLRTIEAAGGDMVFSPSVPEVYARGFDTWVEVGGGLTERFCGASRPGHFRGVATVVLKLFNMVCPDRAYFGRKDYQQLQVIRRLVRDLNLPVEIAGVPTVREDDGLALSSRNKYLSAEERRIAPTLYRALQAAAAAAAAGEEDVAVLRRQALEIIAAQPRLEPEYLEAADGETLQPLTRLRPGAVMLLAARLGGTRLIDNITLA